MTERDKRDALEQRIDNVLIDLADYLAAVIRCERDGGQEWGYGIRKQLRDRRKELCGSMAELLMPTPAEKDE